MGLFQFAVAVLVGAVSVELFSRSWKYLLCLLVCLVLLFRGQIGSKPCRARMHRAALRCILCSLGLILLFRLYLVEVGFGRSELEQMGYLLGIIPVVLRVLKRLPSEIEEMFSGE